MRLIRRLRGSAGGYAKTKIARYNFSDLGTTGSDVGPPHHPASFMRFEAHGYIVQVPPFLSCRALLACGSTRECVPVL
jgi:hypothetical protein